MIRSLRFTLAALLLAAFATAPAMAHKLPDLPPVCNSPMIFGYCL